MAIDPRKLRPSMLTRMLNSTPMGEVVQPHVVYRHLNRAVSRIAAPGNFRRIDLVRYAAWLFHARRETFEPGWTETDYARHKDAVNARGRVASESSRDIAAEGWVHPPVNAERKDACRRSFQGFCEQYFPQTFYLAWSQDHLTVIAKIEQAVLDGGLFAMAMPRGSGKTTLCETACLWALLYGHREFVALIGSDEDHAADMLDSIKSELENNVLLAEDTGPAQSFDGLDSRGLDNLGIEGEHTTCRGARSAAGGAGGVAQVQSRRQRRRRLWLPTECADAGTIARPWNGAGRLCCVQHMQSKSASAFPLHSADVEVRCEHEASMRWNTPTQQTNPGGGVAAGLVAHRQEVGMIVAFVLGFIGGASMTFLILALLAMAGGRCQ